MNTEEMLLLIALVPLGPFLYFLYKAEALGLHINKNLAGLFGGFIYIILLFYSLMINIMPVRDFIEREITEDSLRILSLAGLEITLFYCGALFGLSNNRINLLKKNKFIKNNSNILLIEFIKWGVLTLLIISYLLFFRDKSYITIHLGSGFYGVPLKLVYLIYGSVIVYGLKYKVKNSINIIIFTISFFIVYGLLYQLRSPLLVYGLIIFYIYGDSISYKRILIYGLLSMSALSLIAISRDMSLLDEGFELAFLRMILGIGEQANTLYFSDEYVNNDKIMWGSGFFNSLMGLNEPIANFYARYLNNEYFDAGGGYGFYFISDLIVNFGWYFSPFIMALLGYLLVKISINKNTLIRIITISIYCNSFSLVRNDFGSTFRAVIYTVISCYLILFISTNIKEKK